METHGITTLREARARGAELAVLPEIPLNPWSPATKEARDEDAEPSGGPRQERLAGLAREIGIALVGGAIVRDDPSGRRFNTGFAFDARGELRGTHRKSHLPEEPGFWETSHYEAGEDPPRLFRFEDDGFAYGIQICSDVNRTEGTNLLAAAGADAVLAPRATEAATWERWRTVLIANALTNAVYVLSVNRPGAENGVEIGGPSFAVGPGGDVLLETEETLALVQLERERIRSAGAGYSSSLSR